jgi:GntR family transcriptional regulator, transcriptional repressor for pyruvate dehydrogenase complex
MVSGRYGDAVNDDIATSILRRDTLADQVREALLTDVRTSEPGDVLPSEAKLTQRFGVGRQVIREAFQSLQALGVVEIVNGKGAVVLPLSSDPLRGFFERAISLKGDEAGSVVELLEVRRGIEVQSAQLAAVRRSPDQLEAIMLTCEQMAGAVDDPQRYSELDARFHLEIGAASGNTMLALLLEAIREPIRTTIDQGMLAQDSGSRHQRIQELHALVAQQIAAGDAGAAGEAMAVHFDEAVFALLQERRDAR